MSKPSPNKKTPKEKFDRLVTVGFRAEEYERLYRHSQQTTCRSFSEYVRQILLKRKVTVYTRSRSLDELVRELIELRKEFSRLSEDYRAHTSGLSAESGTPGLKLWALVGEQRYSALQVKVQEIYQQIQKIAEVWYQKSAV